MEIRTSNEIPAGAVRVHWGSIANVLRPRGGIMEKESLSLDVYERLMGAFETWTDDAYGDNPSRDDVVATILANLESEIAIAREAFLKTYDA